MGAAVKRYSISTFQFIGGTGFFTEKVKLKCSGNLPFGAKFLLCVPPPATFVPFQAFLRDPDGYFIKLCTYNHTEDAMNAMNLKEKAASTPSTLVLADDQPKDEGNDGEGDIRGIRKFWKKVKN